MKKRKLISLILSLCFLLSVSVAVDWSTPPSRWDAVKEHLTYTQYNYPLLQVEGFVRHIMLNEMGRRLVDQYYYNKIVRFPKVLRGTGDLVYYSYHGIEKKDRIE